MVNFLKEKIDILFSNKKGNSISLNGEKHDLNSDELSIEIYQDNSGKIKSGAMFFTGQDIKLQLFGDIHSVNSTNGNIEVSGSVKTVSTINGNVSAKEITDSISTVNGNVFKR